MSSNGEDDGANLFWLDTAGVFGGAAAGECIGVDESTDDLRMLADEF